jgi:hypothetical protein
MVYKRQANNSVSDGGFRVRRANGRKLLLLALAAFACIGVVQAVRAVARQFDPFEARSFDPAAWAAAESEVRATMSRDAIRHLPPGTPEAKIESLLGLPNKLIETSRLTSSYPRVAVRTYSYYLGCWSGRYHDSTFLWVHVGADGLVVAAVIGGG